jgi:lactoylglutathione lyase/glyoxylase I family protein
MFSRIAHVCLHVRDLERSLSYYRTLGFEIRFRFTRQGKPYGAYLELAQDSFIEIFEDPKLGEVVNNGLAHFCLETADLPALMAELDARGVTYTPKSLGCDQTWQIWLTDPDGNRFEVHQYTPESAQRQGGTIEVSW